MARSVQRNLRDEVRGRVAEALYDVGREAGKLRVDGGRVVAKHPASVAHPAKTQERAVTRQSVHSLCLLCLLCLSVFNEQAHYFVLFL